MNQPKIHTTLATLAFCAIAVAAAAQPAEPDQRLVVALSDPSRPAVLEISLFSGDIHVEGYDGKEIVIVADAPLRDADELEEPRADGLRRIQSSSLGLTVEEKDNTVSVHMDFSPKGADLDVRVPRRTSVHAGLVNGGDIEVIGVTGEHELSNVNGDVVATDVAGSAVINSTNGDVRATFTEVNATRPMSLSSFNGDVDVTLPAKLAADLLVTSQQGDVFTDFDVAIQQDPAVVESNGDAGGRYRVRMQRTTRYEIGGGGADIQLRTFNGDVMIRKR
jgi:hypothetical protein